MSSFPLSSFSLPFLQKNDVGKMAKTFNFLLEKWQKYIFFYWKNGHSIIIYIEDNYVI